MSVITLGGMTGGGARVLGPLLSEELNADYVDRLMLAEIAKRIGSSVQELSRKEDRPPSFGEKLSGMLQRVLERSAITGAGGDPYFGPGLAAFLSSEYEDLKPSLTASLPNEGDFLKGLRSVFHDLAEQGNVIFVGRGGHIILKDEPKVLRVGIISSTEDRITRLMEIESVNRDQAALRLESRDRSREHFFKEHFGIDGPDDPHLFNIMINTSQNKIEDCVEIIKAAMKTIVK